MSEANTLHVEIVSPEKPLFSGTATAVVAPAYDGEVGILPKHAPMLAQLGVGEVRVSSGTLGGDHTEYFAVSGGFIETSDNHVIILTEIAKAPADVDKATIEEELKASREKLADTTAFEERAKIESRISWLKAQEALLRRQG